MALVTLLGRISGLGTSDYPPALVEALNEQISILMRVPSGDYLRKSSAAASLIPEDWQMTLKEITPGLYVVTLVRGDVVVRSNYSAAAPRGMSLPAAMCAAAL